MSEFRNTWPEKIYLYGDMNKPYKDQDETMGWSEEDFNQNIGYIREDAVKNLIMSAKYNYELQMDKIFTAYKKEMNK